MLVSIAAILRDPADDKSLVSNDNNVAISEYVPLLPYSVQSTNEPYQTYLSSRSQWIPPVRPTAEAWPPSQGPAGGQNTSKSKSTVSYLEVFLTAIFCASF